MFVPVMGRDPPCCFFFVFLTCTLLLQKVRGCAALAAGWSGVAGIDYVDRPPALTFCGIVVQTCRALKACELAHG